MEGKIFDFAAIKKVYETAIGDVTSMTQYVVMIAGIGALLYICGKVWKQWANGGQIDFYGLLRPFAILLVLLNYSVVPVLLDKITDPLITVTQHFKETKEKEYAEKQLKLDELRAVKKKAQDEENKNQDQKFSWKRAIQEIQHSVSNFTSFSWLADGLMIAIEYLIKWYVIAIVHLMLVFTILTKLILIILGPFVFALSIFPKFDNVLQQWFCRYINVCLWIPICNIIAYIMSSIMVVVVLDNAIATEEALEVVSGGGQLSNDLVAIVFLFMSAMMYGMVPTIADWVISGSGTGMFASAVGSAAGKTAKLATAAIGTKVAAASAEKAIGGTIGSSIRQALNNNNNKN